MLITGLSVSLFNARLANNTEDSDLASALNIIIPAWRTRNGPSTPTSARHDFIGTLFNQLDGLKKRHSPTPTQLAIAGGLFSLDRAYSAYKKQKGEIAAQWLMHAISLVTLVDRSSKEAKQAIQSEIARLSAQKRHKEDYELREQAKQYWIANIDHLLSNEKAAFFLSKQVPLAHRTLVSIISEARKDLKT